ncbi:MAG TPA: MBL fold metallo-hydrolase [Candidatus Cloacimonadota bacterium]|nr:MBL fold metallo-hydrolase [Candidatus Cloacimonadota bacterium]
MFQTSVLASGSKGNSILVRTENTAILLDAGLSGNKLFTLLESISVKPTDLKALVISHEHSDHISGAGVMCRKLHIPLYISALTYSSCCHRLGKLPNGTQYFRVGKEFAIDDIIVRSFPSSHDVIDGSNFVFMKAGEEERKLAVATDVGYSSRLMVHNMQESSSVILESNHDIPMLLNGPYPPLLKQRIKSNQGHLSNEQAVGVITQILHPGLKNLILAHLSEQNNLPELAFDVMNKYLIEVKHELKLLVSSQYEATGLIDI